MLVHDHTAFEFLRLFSRFEFALKRVKCYCRSRTNEEGGDATSNWDTFGADAAAALEQRLREDGHLERAVQLLVMAPPNKEVVRNGVAVFEDANLRDGRTGQALLFAVRRVRNNLFHGGKHQAERYDGHDQALVEQGLVVLAAAREIAGAVAPDLHQHLFD